MTGPPGPAAVGDRACGCAPAAEMTGTLPSDADDDAMMRVRPIKTKPCQPRVWFPLLLVLGVLLNPIVLQGYVLPGKQVLDLMAQKRIAPQTLEVQQAVSQLPLDGAPLAATALRETVNFSYPDRVRTDTVGTNYRRVSIRTAQDRLVVVNGQIYTGPPERFEAYKEILLIETRRAMEAYLLQLGLDLNRTSLGRFEDDYCFVIGAVYPDESAAQLWVQKDTFRPLRLILPPSVLSPQEGLLDVRFRDWGQIEGAAYPMLIQIFRKHQLYREMRVENLRVDPVQDPLLFDTGGLRNKLPQWVPGPIITPPVVPREPSPKQPPPADRF